MPIFWGFFRGVFGPFFLDPLLKNVTKKIEKFAKKFRVFKNPKKKFPKHPFFIKRASWHHTEIFVNFSFSEISGFFGGVFRGLFSIIASQTRVERVQKKCQKIAKMEIFFRFFSKNHKFNKTRFLAA